MSDDLLTDLLEDIRRRRALPPPEVARVIRHRCGVTQSELARVLGVDRVTVARWETGRRTPRGATRTAYVTALRRLAANAVGDGAPRHEGGLTTR